MSFLRPRTNNLNRFFFQKFQQQVSKAPGYKPLLSYEDFLKIMEETKLAKELENKSEDNA